MAFSPDEFKTPGQYIQHLLDERAWGQRVLALLLRVDQAVISGLIQGKRSVDADRALILGEIFSVPPEHFLQLQQSYDLAKARLIARPDPLRSARAKIFGDLPIAEMISRGWIVAENTRDAEAIESGVTRFFGVSALTEVEILPHAAKRTHVVGEVTPAQLAWLYRVRQLADLQIVAPYSTKALVATIPNLRDLLSSVEEARNAPRLLAEAGVRLVVVETIGNAKIDGACFWLNDRQPVIGLSLRHDRIDNFWFVLRHEIEHVLRGDGRASIVLDTELDRAGAGVSDEIEEQERAANIAAAEFCVPQKLLQQFINRKAPLFSERDVLAFAKLARVHPAIVAGQLQHRTSRYDRFRNHLAKVRASVLPNVLHDGWGDVAPVDLSPRGA